MAWPAQATELNPIEHLGGDMLQRNKLSNAEELWITVSDMWHQIPLKTIPRSY